MRYVSGLDLGQASDYTALVVLECPGYASVHVRHFHRWPLGTSYPQIVDDLHELFVRPPLANSSLVVDATGVGRAVVDMIAGSGIRAGVRPWTITAGLSANEEGKTVPKKDLVGAVQALLGQGQLKIAESLPLTPVLVAELEHFRVKVTEDRNETFASWRERDHDDLVLALALAVWDATRSGDPELVRRANAPNMGRTPLDRLPPGTFSGYSAARRR